MKAGRLFGLVLTIACLLLIGASFMEITMMGYYYVLQLYLSVGALPLALALLILAPGPDATFRELKIPFTEYGKTILGQATKAQVFILFTALIAGIAFDIVLWNDLKDDGAISHFLQSMSK